MRRRSRAAGNTPTGSGRRRCSPAATPSTRWPVLSACRRARSSATCAARSACAAGSPRRARPCAPAAAAASATTGGSPPGSWPTTIPKPRSPSASAAPCGISGGATGSRPTSTSGWTARTCGGPAARCASSDCRRARSGPRCGPRSAPTIRSPPSCRRCRRTTTPIAGWARTRSTSRTRGWWDCRRPSPARAPKIQKTRSPQRRRGTERPRPKPAPRIVRRRRLIRWRFAPKAQTPNPSSRVRITMAPLPPDPLRLCASAVNPRSRRQVRPTPPKVRRCQSPAWVMNLRLR